MMILNVWSWLAPVIAGVAGLLIGFLVGFLVARKVFENYMKKNPPINEKMIRTMMQQMGRTPSEKQVRQIMASMNQEK